MYHQINCKSIQKKTNQSERIMSLEFFIIGGIIFMVYVNLMLWNIKYSAKQSKKENYPNLGSTDSSKEIKERLIFIVLNLIVLITVMVIVTKFL